MTHSSESIFLDMQSIGKDDSKRITADCAVRHQLQLEQSPGNSLIGLSGAGDVCVRSRSLVETVPLWRSIVMLLLLVSLQSSALGQDLAKRLNPEVEVGKEIRLRIGTHKKATRFTIAQGPKSIAINYQDGILSWTPRKAELGPQTVIVDFRVKGKKRQVTMNTVVVMSIKPAGPRNAKTNVPAAASNSAAAKAAPTQPSSPKTSVGSQMRDSVAAPLSPSQPSEPNSAPEVVIEKDDSTAPVEFLVADLPHPVTSMEMSQDGTFIAMAHESGNAVSIIDVVTSKITATLDTPSPRNVLVRGNQLIVGSQRNHSIEVYSMSEQRWNRTKTFVLPRPGMVHISLPYTGMFRNRFLVTFHGEGPRASMRDTEVFIGDSRGRFEKIATSRLAQYSYDGQTILLQDSFDFYSGSSLMRGYLATEYLKIGEDATRLLTGGERDAGYAYQVYPGDQWMLRDSIFGGKPLSRMPGNWGDYVIPDRRQRVIYIIGDGKLTARRLDDPSRPITTKEILLPDPFSNIDKLRHPIPRLRDYVLDHPEAVTLGGTLYLYCRTALDGVVIAARLPAVEIPSKPIEKEIPAAIKRLAYAASQPRTWKSKKGSHRVTATLVAVSGENVNLLRADTKKRVTVPLNSLSSSDQSYIKRLVDAGIIADVPDQTPQKDRQGMSAVAAVPGPSMQPGASMQKPSMQPVRGLSEKGNKLLADLKEINKPNGATRTSIDYYASSLQISSLSDAEKQILVPHLVALLSYPGHPGRGEICMALGGCGIIAADAIPDLVEFGETTSHPAFREQAYRAVAMAGGVAEIESAMKSPAWKVRVVAITAAADLPKMSAKIEELLLRHARGPIDEAETYRAVESIGAIRPYTEALAQMHISAINIGSTNLESAIFRRHALRGMGRSGLKHASAKAAIEKLSAGADDDLKTHIRNAKELAAKAKD